MIRKFTSEKQKIGELGENIACKFLVKNGFKIIERNYTRKWGEIDIVAEKNTRLHFVEVKSISKNLDIISNNKEGSERFGYRPEENMNSQKSKRILRVVQTFLINKKLGNNPWQIDLAIVYIDINKRLARVKTLENLVL